jgi:hypothetical protein
MPIQDVSAVMNAIHTTLRDAVGRPWTTVELNRDVEERPFEESEYPAVNIIQGEFQETILGFTLLDVELLIGISFYAVDTDIQSAFDIVNELSGHVYAEIMEPFYAGGGLFGLAYVWNVIRNSPGALQVSESAGVHKAGLTDYYTVKFRTTHRDLGGY